MYGLMERQFHNYYVEAARRKGSSGENLLTLLECRLDNVGYRLGFAGSRAQARQLVRHGHITVGDRRLNIPSARVKVDDVIAVREKSRENQAIKQALEAVARRPVPGWLELDPASFSGTVKALPTREELTMPMQEQLIVELYSR